MHRDHCGSLIFKMKSEEVQNNSWICFCRLKDDSTHVMSVTKCPSEKLAANRAVVF